MGLDISRSRPFDDGDTGTDDSFLGDLGRVRARACVWKRRDTNFGIERAFKKFKKLKIRRVILK